jgi:hypothetical protein
MVNKFCLLFATAITSSLPSHVEAATSIKSLDQLKLCLRRSIELRILHLPHSLTTRVNVTPEAITAYAPLFHRTISRKENPEIFARLETALAETDVQRSKEAPNVRWGCVLYSSDGRRIGSFYLEKKYKNRADVTGVFDGMTVNCNPALLRWFEQSFPEAAQM